MSKLDDNTGVTNPASYMMPMDMYNNSVEEYTERNTNDGGENVVLRTYKFYDIFPTAIGDIQLSYDNNTFIETFTVDFQVQYISIGDSLQSSQR